VGRITKKISELLTSRSTTKKTKTPLTSRPPQPVILTRDKHPISRKNIDPDALKVLYRLHNHGYIAYLVGGGVRDLLLDKQPKDFDVGTNARPREIKHLFRNSLIIGRRFKIAHIRFRGNKIIEVTTFRAKSESDVTGDDIHHRRDNTFGTPQEDANRRDITINGLFYNIADFTVIDYVGGLTDLENGIIRIIGDPPERFIEDPVRMIRVLRHAARTGFHIDKSTGDGIKKLFDKITLCPPARIHEELLKDLRSGHSEKTFQFMNEFGILKVLFPTTSRLIENGKISIEFILTSLSFLDSLTRAGTQPSIPFLFSVILFPSIRALISETIEGTDEQHRDIPRLIHQHLLESARVIGISKKSMDTMRQILFLNWKMFTFIDRGFLPFYLRKKAHFWEAFDLFGLTSRAFGYFPDESWPIVAGEPNPLKRLLKPPPRGGKGRRRSRRPAKKSP
jgi:poly(A) polymerase